MTDKNKKNEVLAIDKKITPVQAKVEALEVVDEKSEREANEMLSQANKLGDLLAEDKAKIYDPAWAAVVAIREKYKPRETMIKNIVDTLRAKLTKYRTAEKARIAAEENKITDKVEKGKLKVETGVRKMDEIERPAAAVATESGVTKYKTVKKFEVKDVTKLPAKYLLPNEVEIRKAMQAGIELDGVRYYEEEVPVNFRG